MLCDSLVWIAMLQSTSQQNDSELLKLTSRNLVGYDVNAVVAIL